MVCSDLASVNITAPIPIARDKFVVAKVDNSVVDISPFSDSNEEGKKITTKEWNARAPLITPSEMSMPQQNIFGLKQKKSSFEVSRLLLKHILIDSCFSFRELMTEVASKSLRG